MRTLIRAACESRRERERFPVSAAAAAGRNGSCSRDETKFASRHLRDVCTAFPHAAHPVVVNVRGGSAIWLERFRPLDDVFYVHSCPSEISGLMAFQSRSIESHSGRKALFPCESHGTVTPQV